MFAERPFPEAARLQLQRFHKWTAVGFFFGLSGACIFASWSYDGPGDILVTSETAPWLLPMLLVFVWCGYRTFRFFWGWPCPQCSRALKIVNRRESQTGNILLACRTCEIDWDCGLAAGEGGPSSGN